MLNDFLIVRDAESLEAGEKLVAERD